LAYSITIDESTDIVHIEKHLVFIRRVSEDLLLVEKLLGLFLMKRNASDDEVSSQSVILLNKLELLCKKVRVFNDGSACD
jgi:hypothetical protein